MKLKIILFVSFFICVKAALQPSGIYFDNGKKLMAQSQIVSCLGLIRIFCVGLWSTSLQVFLFNSAVLLSGNIRTLGFLVITYYITLMLLIPCSVIYILSCLWWCPYEALNSCQSLLDLFWGFWVIVKFFLTLNPLS